MKSVWVLLQVFLLMTVAGCGRTDGQGRREEKLKEQKSREVYIDTERLEKLWVTQPELRIPESVLYDGARNVIYVSNIDGKPSAADGRGFISLLGPDGKVTEREWVKGLDAPKGLGIYGDTLYVSDIRSLVVISIPEKKIIARHTAPEAVFLNDVAVAPDGTVYVSDMGASAVYRLQEGRFVRWLTDKKLKSPNGLFVEGDHLLAGLQDRIVSIDLRTKKVSDYILHTGSIDGLEADGKGNYLISDWKGHIYRVNTRGEKRLLLDTTPINMQAADIDFVPGSSTLLVPTFNNNRVVAYRVK